jgi:hypothetical protein
MASKSFLARRVRNVTIYVHTAGTPSDAEWDTVLSFYDNANDEQQLRTLVYTAGAAPNAAQRARLNDALGARRVRIAVLTPSSLARAAGTAVGWFRPEVRAFGASDESRAIAHLGIGEEIARDVLKALGEMKRELGLDKRTTAISS